MTLWIFFMSSFLICTTLASHNGYSDYDSPKLEQNSGTHKGSFSDSRWTASDDERNNYPYAQEGPLARGKVMDLNAWPVNDAMSLSRQIFGEKSSDSSEPILRRDASLDDEDMAKSKRESHSLSIVNPLDVLRQRLMLEMARRRMKENQDQIRENALILKNLGKRSSFSSMVDMDNNGGMDARSKQDFIRRIQVSNSEDFEV
ncbi:CRF domain-containing protein [Trichonephila clavipes]|nr:CRF domain-containing protein [Trichonephila clavipes]